MEDKIEFESSQELYERVLPALNSKVLELRRVGYNHVNEIDIWNYLKEKTWKNRVNLELHEIISDILNLNNYEINEHVMSDLVKIKNGGLK